MGEQADFERCFFHRIPAFVQRQGAAQVASLFMETADAVVHHDHDAVHNDAEVQSAQAHEVSRDARLLHYDEGGEKRQRDGEGRDERGPQVPQEQE